MINAQSCDGEAAKRSDDARAIFLDLDNLIEWIAFAVDRANAVIKRHGRQKMRPVVLQSGRAIDRQRVNRSVVQAV